MSDAVLFVRASLFPLIRPSLAALVESTALAKSAIQVQFALAKDFLPL